jgi:hypothetical protein
MNRVHCGVCAEVALASPLVAEALEGLGVCCTHCGAFGRVVMHENDEGGIGSLELRVKPCAECGGPEAACDCHPEEER